MTVILSQSDVFRFVSTHEGQTTKEIADAIGGGNQTKTFDKLYRLSKQGYLMRVMDTSHHKRGIARWYRAKVI